MTVFIYHLVDEAGRVRYVGQTIHPNKRLTQHLRGACGRHCRRWIAKMLREGVRPAMRVIAEVDAADADAAELREIERQQSAGARLVNIQYGPGDNPHSIRSADRHSKAMRRRYRDADFKELQLFRLKTGRLRRFASGPPADEPESITRARALRTQIMRKFFRLIPPPDLPETQARPERQYFTITFVRRHAADLQRWLAQPIPQSFIEDKLIAQRVEEAELIELAGIFPPSSRRASPRRTILPPPPQAPRSPPV